MTIDLRNVPVLCRDHLRRAGEVYRSQIAPEIKESSFRMIIAEAEACPRCLEVRRRETERAESLPQPPPSWQGNPLVESYSREAVDFRTFVDNQRKELERAGILPLPRLPEDLLRKVMAIPSGDPEWRPAAVRLVDGSSLPRVIFIKEEHALARYIGFWAHFLRADKVAEVTPSPYQIPAPIAKRIHRVGETSMGGLEFQVIMTDGRRFTAFYGGYSEFISLPEPYKPDQIVDVVIERGLASKHGLSLKEPDYLWCALSPVST